MPHRQGLQALYKAPLSASHSICEQAVEPSHSNHWAPAIAAAVFLLGLGMALFSLFELKAWHIAGDVEQHCADQQGAIQMFFNREVVDVVQNAESFLTNRGNLSAADYTRRNQRAALNFNYIFGIGVFQHVLADQRASWEAYFQKNISRLIGSKLTPDFDNYTEYWPNLFTYNVEGTNVQGFNGGSEPLRAQAIHTSYISWQQHVAANNGSIAFNRAQPQPCLTPPVSIVSDKVHSGYTLWHVYSDDTVQLIGPPDIPTEAVLNLVFYNNILAQLHNDSILRADAVPYGYRLFDVTSNVPGSQNASLTTGNGVYLDTSDRDGHRFLEQWSPTGFIAMENYATQQQFNILNRQWELQCIPFEVPGNTAHYVTPYVVFALVLIATFLLTAGACHLVLRLRHAKNEHDALEMSRQLVSALRVRSQACVEIIPNAMILLDAEGFIVGLNNFAAPLIPADRTERVQIRDLVVSDQQCVHPDDAAIDCENNLICPDCRGELCRSAATTPASSGPQLNHRVHFHGLLSPRNSGHTAIDVLSDSPDMITEHPPPPPPPEPEVCTSHRTAESFSQVVLIRDITQKKQLQRKLELAQGAVKRANKAKEDMLLLLSHELRNPNYVIGSSAKMMYENTAFASAEDDLRAIILSSEHMQRLVDDSVFLLDLQPSAQAAITDGAVDIVTRQTTRSCADAMLDVLESQCWYMQLRRVRVRVTSNMNYLRASLNRASEICRRNVAIDMPKLSSDIAQMTQDVMLTSNGAEELTKITERLLHHSIQVSAAQTELQLILIATLHPEDLMRQGRVSFLISARSRCAEFAHFAAELAAPVPIGQGALYSVTGGSGSQMLMWSVCESAPHMRNESSHSAALNMHHLASKGHSFGSGFGIPVLQKMVTHANASVTTNLHAMPGMAVSSPRRSTHTDVASQATSQGTSVTAEIPGRGPDYAHIRDGKTRMQSSSKDHDDEDGVAISIHVDLRGVICDSLVTPSLLVPPVPDTAPVSLETLGVSAGSSVQPDDNPTPQPLYVLVVEDNKLVQKVTMRLLTALGCEVATADDGKIATERSDLGSFDIIFMDLVMPNMDGYEATAFIRKSLGLSPATLPIVALTANAVEEERTRVMSTGHFNDFCTKPAAKAKLASVLETWTRRQQTG
ncbi:hypothetical protein RI367_006428 [Sorochytrium milnesiophthora]